MKDSDSGSDLPDIRRVRERAQAELLSDPTAFRFFEPFLGRENTAKRAADEIGVALDTMLYRIGRLRAAGLLEVVREAPRAGRPIKVYRSSADGYYVPFELTGFAEIKEQLRDQLRQHDDEIVDAGARALRELGEEGRRIFRDADGEVVKQSASEHGKRVDIGDERALRDVPGPAFEVFSAQLRLDDAEAKELLIALYRLHERYARVSTENRADGVGSEFVFAFQLASVR